MDPSCPLGQLIRTYRIRFILPAFGFSHINNLVIDPVDFSVLTQYDVRIHLVNGLTNFVILFDSRHGKKKEFVRSNQPVNIVLQSMTLFACRRKPRALPSAGNPTLHQLIIINCYLPGFLESDGRPITLSVSNIF